MRADSRKSRKCKKTFVYLVVYESNCIFDNLRADVLIEKIQMLQIPSCNNNIGTVV